MDYTNEPTAEKPRRGWCLSSQQGHGEQVASLSGATEEEALEPQQGLPGERLNNRRDSPNLGRGEQPSSSLCPTIPSPASPSFCLNVAGSQLASWWWHLRNVVCERSGNGSKIKQVDDPHIVLFAIRTAAPRMAVGT